MMTTICHRLLLWVFYYKKGDNSYDCRHFFLFFSLFEKKKIMEICHLVLWVFCCEEGDVFFSSLCLRRRKRRPFFFSSPFAMKNAL